MTVDELSKMQYIQQDIARDAERLDELRAKAYAPGSPNISGVRQPRNFSSRVEAFAVKIAEAERRIADKQVRYIREWAKLERYIAAIPDSLTRQILTLRFVDGESWGRIAFELGGNNTAESVRTRVHRYLRASR